MVASTIGRAAAALLVLAGLGLPQPAPARGRPVPVPEQIQEWRLLRRVPPVYPPKARELRITGTVRLRVVISADGLVLYAGVISGHPWLVRAAVQAVRQWIYQPAYLAGRPVAVMTTVSVRFPPPRQPQPYLSVSTATPGNSRPERNSREAPPPVEM
ncbi:MAG: energy transducer TonB [Bryobacterales bacterium]|nr:energy transducer TonB [Bryobacterales bacterium]